MKPLGIGVRVYVLWAAPQMRQGPTADRVTCNTGTITAGPFPRGTLHNIAGKPFALGEKSWHVLPDGVGTSVVAERFLVPIDDDDDSGDLVEQREELETT